MLVFGSFVFFLMERNLTAEADQNIARIAEDILNNAKIVGLPLRVVLPDVDVFATPNTYIQAVDRTGILAAQSENLGGQSMPLSEETLHKVAKGNAFYETVMSGRQSLRVYNQPLILNNQVIGVLQVGRSLEPTEAALNRLRLLMLFGGGISLFLTGTLGWLLAGAALKPIDRITETASAIEQAHDLDRRIDYSGPRDEVGRLAGTLNLMLERLQKAYRSLEEAEAAQRRFVSDASHELRTPLTTIRGNVELLRKMGDADPETRAEALADIAGESERMSRLVADLLVLARADASLKLRKDEVELEPFLAEVARQGSLLAGELDFTAGDFTALKGKKVLGDYDYLKQLLLILIENAVNYTPAGGKVRLEAQVKEAAAEISVIDNGVGISEEDLPKIFERFYRADKARSGSGTGLGLAIARWIAGEHGGEIKVQSREGAGSTFTVCLPLVL
jgi:signal transduction histidine kinase